MTTTPAPDRLGVLDPAKCFRLLSTQTVGRVVYTDGALPAVAPVNYALDGHRIIFRTSPLSRLALGVVDQVVAFEVDSLDAEVRTGWSVVVTGIARALIDSGELTRAAALQLSPWAGGERALFVCITPGVVTGRFVASQ
jgi:uncharacterized protein